jgi:hypothetical protein
VYSARLELNFFYYLYVFMFQMFKRVSFIMWRTLKRNLFEFLALFSHD